MTLYGRPITAITTSDKLPILDVSAVGDEAQLRDTTVAGLQNHLQRLITLAGATPTLGELPASQWGVFKTANGPITLFAREANNTLVTVAASPIL